MIFKYYARIKQPASDRYDWEKRIKDDPEFEKRVMAFRKFKQKNIICEGDRDEYMHLLYRESERSLIYEVFDDYAIIDEIEYTGDLPKQFYRKVFRWFDPW